MAENLNEQQILNPPQEVEPAPTTRIVISSRLARDKTTENLNRLNEITTNNLI